MGVQENVWVCGENYKYMKDLVTTCVNLETV